MSPLMISEEKVKHALALSTAPPFEVGVELAYPPRLKEQEGQFVISGTVSIPPNNESARKNLMAAFSRIDSSGISLKNEGELSAELDEIRRRNL